MCSRRAFAASLAGAGIAAASALSGCSAAASLLGGGGSTLIEPELATLFDSSFEASEDSAATETESGPATATIRMVGDILVQSGVWKSGAQSDGSYNFDHLFAHMADLFESADLAIVNQETILGGTELGLSGPPTYNSPQEIGDAEAAVGVDVACAATNHAMDQGFAGIEAELEFWRSEHPEVTCIGIADTEELANTIHLFECNGIQIALLNYTSTTNGISRPSDATWCVSMIDDATIEADIAEARELGADIVVVVPHTGTEYSHEPNSYQREMASKYLEWGVDVVISNHPHVIQPVEVLEGDDGQRMLMFWSLGNYVSYQVGLRETLVGGMAEVTFEKADDACTVASWTFYPTVTHAASGTDMGVYLLSDYTEELASANRVNSAGYVTGFTREYCLELCEEVLGEGFDADACTLSGTVWDA